ncbi:hypothetical protein [Methylogaea oryzae]|uniref:hypothetical protein n=1 Tax=Methylogaea oryzae TaxID=1295382 RepID=UPI001C803286|nr:hypothetical protein [Methylogaea oryzae]
MDERRFDGAWRYGLSVAEIAPSLPLKPIYPPMNLTSITLAKIAKKLTGRDGEDPSFARFFALIQQVEKSCFKKTFVLATFRSIPPRPRQPWPCCRTHSFIHSFIHGFCG